MKIAGIKHTSLADGEGLNYVIFVQGCERSCDGCHNPSTWKKDGGAELSLEELKEDIKRYCPPVTGVTFSGGEPLLQVDDVLKLARWAKGEGLKTALYSGYKLEDIVSKLHAAGVSESPIDEIFDGAFEKSKTFPDVPFRGSNNQKWYKHVSGLKYESWD